MRRLLLVVLAFAACTVCLAQQTNHVIQRGETFELIARRYNISVAQLLAANPGVDQCFAGMKLNLPTEAKMNDRLYTITPQDILQIEEASGYLKSGKYKKAASAYSKVIENNPSSTLYFGRALSYYNREKYKSAISDFEMAMTRPDCSDEMRTKCQQLVIKARELREAQLARRNETWGGVAAFIVGAAAVTATAVMANNSSGGISYMPPSSANGFQRDTSLDYLLDPRLAMVQAQQQEYEEYETFKKLSGANISLEEYRMLKAQSDYQSKFDNDIDNSSDADTYKGKMSPDYYQQAYRRWEHAVESHFNSLTVVGSKYEDKNGNIKGTTGDMKSWAVIGISSNFREAQREMRKIRLEAAKYGVNIVQSKWETATSKVGY